MASSSTSITIPEVTLSSGSRKIPVIGLGTAAFPIVGPEIIKSAVIKAIEIGYRHFDTAAIYQTEQPLGEAIAEALSLGLIQTRDQLFVTSKLWISEAHPNLVVPALKETLGNLKLEYLDLYLIHLPVSCKPGHRSYPPKDEDLLAMDFKSVWADMEECKRLGLTKSIGVGNFSCKKIDDLLVTANIPPAVNQVEMNPLWQQKKLMSFCKEKGILVTAYSPLGAAGAVWGSNRVMESQVLKDIAESKGKTVAQVCMRWAYEQGVVVVVKSFNEKRLRENLQIFDWELSDEDYKKIGEIHQIKASTCEQFIAPNGPYKTAEEFWDGEI